MLLNHFCLASSFNGLIYCCSRGSPCFVAEVVYALPHFPLQHVNHSYSPVFLILVIVFFNLIKENNSQLKKQLQNLEKALESTRQSAKNEEHKSNLLIAEKVTKNSANFCCPFL